MGAPASHLWGVRDRVGSRPRRGVAPGLARRALDVLIAGIALLLFLPLLVLVALAIRVTSPGPAIFKQERTGQGRRTFTIYKFRTMVQRSGGSMLTAPGDDRITGLGRFLRATCIDELPQLINILVGDMTLVGPRPQTLSLAARYPEAAAEVLEHRPGLTGPGVIRMNDEDVLPGATRDVEDFYFRRVVPARAALDLAYLADPTLRKTISFIIESALVPLRVFRPSGGTAPIALPSKEQQTSAPVLLPVLPVANADASTNVVSLAPPAELEIELTDEGYESSSVSAGAPT